MRAASGATPLGRLVHAASDPKIRVMIDRLMLVLRFIGTSFLSLIRRGSLQDYDDFRLHTWLNREVGAKLIDKRVFTLDAVSAGPFQDRVHESSGIKQTVASPRAVAISSPLRGFFMVHAR